MYPTQICPPTRSKSCADMRNQNQETEGVPFTSWMLTGQWLSSLEAPCALAGERQKKRRMQQQHALCRSNCLLCACHQLACVSPKARHVRSLYPSLTFSAPIARSSSSSSHSLLPALLPSRSLSPSLSLSLLLASIWAETHHAVIFRSHLFPG